MKQTSFVVFLPLDFALRRVENQLYKASGESFLTRHFLPIVFAGVGVLHMIIFFVFSGDLLSLLCLDLSSSRSERLAIPPIWLPRGKHCPFLSYGYPP